VGRGTRAVLDGEERTLHRISDSQRQAGRGLKFRTIHSVKKAWEIVVLRVGAT